jgi:hypothetical protein
MRITSAISAPLLVLTLALAGCGGDDSDDDSNDADDNTSVSESDETEPGDDSEEPDSGDGGDEQVDVCALITTADLEEAFGSPFAEGEFTHQEQTGGDQCVWSNTDAPPVKVFSVTVIRDGHLSEGFEGAGVTAESLHEDTKELTPNTEAVDGLGDYAFLAGTQLAVLDGGSYWTFSTTTGDSPEAIAGMKSLAEQIIG